MLMEIYFVPVLSDLNLYYHMILFAIHGFVWGELILYEVEINDINLLGNWFLVGVDYFCLL